MRLKVVIVGGELLDIPPFWVPLVKRASASSEKLQILLFRLILSGASLTVFDLGKGEILEASMLQAAMCINASFKELINLDR